MSTQLAPELHAAAWLNTDRPLQLANLRDRVVVLHAFQMLCPGCVSHGVSQAERVHRLFAREEVTVIGLHSVFEHHDAMTPVSLKAFLHEYRVTHPVAVDEPTADDPIPATMRSYGFEGTPTLCLIDRAGQIRLQHFGRLDDMVVGAEVMRLVAGVEKADPRGS